MSKIDKCKAEAIKLAKEAAEYLDFYNSLSKQDLNTQGFNEDYNQYMTIPQRLQLLANEIQDTAFTKQISDIIGKYNAAW